MANVVQLFCYNHYEYIKSITIILLLADECVRHFHAVCHLSIFVNYVCCCSPDNLSMRAPWNIFCFPNELLKPVHLLFY